MSARRMGLTYVRDALLFLLGCVIILKQAGIGFVPPAGGPNIELLGVGALFCNGPLFLQWVALRRGISGSSAEPAPQHSELSSARSSESSEGDV